MFAAVYRFSALLNHPARFIRLMLFTLPLTLSLGLSPLATAYLPADVETSSPAARIKSRLYQIDAYEKPLLQDLTCLRTGLQHQPQTLQGLGEQTEEQKDLYQKNRQYQETLFRSVSQQMNQNTAQFHTELQQLQSAHDQLRERYLSFSASDIRVGYYVVIAAATYGTFKAITWHPLYAGASFLAAGALYHLLNTVHSQTQENLREDMRNKSASMEELESRALAHFKTISQLGLELSNSRWRTLQNQALIQNLPLFTSEEVPSTINKRYQRNRDFMVLNDIAYSLDQLPEQLSPFLGPMSEIDVFVLTFANDKTPQASTQNLQPDSDTQATLQSHQSYRLLRHQGTYYLGLPIINAKGLEQPSFISFPDTASVMTFLHKTGQLCNQKYFGFMSFQRG